MNFKKIVLSKLNSFSFASLLNKYALVTAIFIVWVSFFDRYSLINQIKLSNNIEQLQEAKADYERQLEEALKEREIINQDIEKYAREKYLFHKDNEKVILIK
ncbi:MAG: septum formation initiator family protein [Saprospiraceae bacterium]|nr:septum formation initiator family protein [Bacteroidia bacterium]NNE16069.1 septum formation initiator family protein [Saprospiraceae bacterium]NNL91246.1 septum formation initiator family protein [Saprospiraceae bacterium]